MSDKYDVLTNERKEVCVVEKAPKRIVFDGTWDALGELLEREKEHQETMRRSMLNLSCVSCSKYPGCPTPIVGTGVCCGYTPQQPPAVPEVVLEWMADEDGDWYCRVQGGMYNIVNTKGWEAFWVTGIAPCVSLRSGGSSLQEFLACLAACREHAGRQQKGCTDDQK